ncbi:MAG: type I methionyl aminopeptidase [Spirochaetia bacterium]
MNKYIPLKTSPEIARIRIAGTFVARTLRSCLELVTEGAVPVEIDRYCGDLIQSASEKKIDKPEKKFPAWLTISINNVAVHGIPRREPLEAGDIVTLDLSLSVDGWYADMAETVTVGNAGNEASSLVDAARMVTEAAVSAVRAGGVIRDIGIAAENTAKKLGCRVIPECSGHGIGKSPHEEPVLVHTADGTLTPIVSGMVLCVEPVVTYGTGELVLMDDNWGYKTADGKGAAQFERTVAVYSDRTEILTAF